MATAEKQQRMLLVFFHRLGENRLREHFESQVLGNPSVAEKLRSYVCVKLATDAAIRIEGQATTLLQHKCFAGMCGGEGIAVLDFAHKDAPYYGCVVSTFPFSDGCCYSARQMSVILDLGPGTPQERYAQYAAGVRSRPQRSQPPRDERPAPVPAEIAWLSDYHQAVERAEQQGRLLLIYFRCGADEQCGRFERETLGDAAVLKGMAEYVCLRLPRDATIASEGKSTRLLEHAAFREMLGRPGIAIVDYQHRDRRHYGYVVNVFPLTGRLFYSPPQVLAMLDLPPGTLTQRTLIWAVRTHPDRPASTRGQADPMLLTEAESHSQHQADIRVQGHHRWESRFHNIVGRLPAGMTASEVCAESWPGENLVEAAVECVRCWRLSDGHWSAVRSLHRLFGYDMKRGQNGIWYATGIFGRG